MTNKDELIQLLQHTKPKHKPIPLIPYHDGYAIQLTQTLLSDFPSNTTLNCHRCNQQVGPDDYTITRPEQDILYLCRVCFFKSLIDD